MIEAVGARPPGSLQEVYLQAGAGQAGGQLPDPSAADHQAFDAAMARAEAQAQIEPAARTDVVAAAVDNPWIVPPSVSGSAAPAQPGLGDRLMDTVVEVRDVWDTQRSHIEMMRTDPTSMSRMEMMGLFYDIQQSTMVYGLVVNEVNQVDSKIEGILRTG